MELRMLVDIGAYYFILFFELNHRLVDTEEVLGLARQVFVFGLKAKSLALP